MKIDTAITILKHLNQIKNHIKRRHVEFASKLGISSELSKLIVDMILNPPDYRQFADNLKSGKISDDIFDTLDSYFNLSKDYVYNN